RRWPAETRRRKPRQCWWAVACEIRRPTIALAARALSLRPDLVERAPHFVVELADPGRLGRQMLHVSVRRDDDARVLDTGVGDQREQLLDALVAYRQAAARHLAAVDEDVAAQVLSLVALGPGQVARARVVDADREVEFAVRVEIR